MIGFSREQPSDLCPGSGERAEAHCLLLDGCLADTTCGRCPAEVTWDRIGTVLDRRAPAVHQGTNAAIGPCSK